jgi:hypothetical protein
MTMAEPKRGIEKIVWLIVRDGGILDVIFTMEETAKFMAGDGDEVVPYTISI